jgi:hypothetical protein
MSRAQFISYLDEELDWIPVLPRRAKRRTQHWPGVKESQGSQHAVFWLLLNSCLLGSERGASVVSTSLACENHMTLTTLLVFTLGQPQWGSNGYILSNGLSFKRRENLPPFSLKPWAFHEEAVKKKIYKLMNKPNTFLPCDKKCTWTEKQQMNKHTTVTVKHISFQRVNKHVGPWLAVHSL